jgi:hypothetical protein
MRIRNRFIRHFYSRPADDGSEGGAGGAVGTGNDARIALLNQIGDTLDESRSDELANVNDDDTTEPFRVEKLAPEDDTRVPDPEVTPPASEVAPEPAAPKKFKLKVNGRELELTQEELIARAQKVESADEYLRTAKQTARQADPEPPRPSAEELQRQQDEEDRALVRAIQMGTEEEAAAALRKLRQQASARPSINMDDVSRTIDERLEFNTAITQFNKDFSDIVSDPFLKKLALDRDTELLAQGDTRQYSERYLEIGQQLRAWKESLAPATAAPTSPTTSEKLERKAAAPAVPTSATAKTKAPAAEVDEDDTPSSVIANMAKSRGGPQWMRS